MHYPENVRLVEQSRVRTAGLTPGCEQLVYRWCRFALKLARSMQYHRRNHQIADENMDSTIASFWIYKYSLCGSLFIS